MWTCRRVKAHVSSVDLLVQERGPGCAGSSRAGADKGGRSSGAKMGMVPA
jgi:hypothetical protein